MNESARQRGVGRIAKELCQLYQQQIETLQEGTLTDLGEGELKRYSDRKRRARELRVALVNLRTQSSENRM
jgi:hypothetical protein